MQYQHPEYGVVTPLAWFSSHVNVQTVQGVRPVQSADLTAVDESAPIAPVAAVETTALTESLATETTEAKTSTETETETKQPDLDLLDGKQEPDPNLVNLNTATMTQLNRSLPFVGNKRAKLIVANRPEGGYRTWEQFRDLNPNLLEEETAWAKLAELVTV
jgi:DNA uptake protein ComE-like DNA-binding protein